MRCSGHFMKDFNHKSANYIIIFNLVKVGECISEMSETKIYLSEKEIPTHWYNIMADMPNLPKPPLNPQTLQPAGPPDLTPIFPMDLIMQEVSQDRFLEIPEEVRDYINYGAITGIPGPQTGESLRYSAPKFSINTKE